MSGTRHTSGEWTQRGNIITAQIEDRENVAIMYLPKGDTPNSRTEALANARLIAAAPELLEACEAALDGNDEHRKVVAKLRAAIAKATEA